MLAPPPRLDEVATVVETLRVSSIVCTICCRAYFLNMEWIATDFKTRRLLTQLKRYPTPKKIAAADTEPG